MRYINELSNFAIDARAAGRGAGSGSMKRRLEELASSNSLHTIRGAHKSGSKKKKARRSKRLSYKGRGKKRTGKKKRTAVKRSSSRRSRRRK